MPALSFEDRVELIKQEIARYGGFIIPAHHDIPEEYFVGGGPMIGLYRKYSDDFPTFGNHIKFDIEKLVGLPQKLFEEDVQGSHQQAQNWFKSMLPVWRAWKECIHPKYRGFLEPDFELSFVDHPGSTRRGEKPPFRAFVARNSGILDEYQRTQDDELYDILLESLRDIFGVKSDRRQEENVLGVLTGHLFRDIPLLEAYTKSPHSWDYIAGIEQVMRLHTAATLAGLSSDDVAKLVAKEPWRCRQFEEIYTLVQGVTSPRLRRGLARRYFQDNNLDAAANQLLPDVPRAKKLLPVLMQSGLDSQTLRLLRQAEIKDTAWDEKLLQKYEIAGRMPNAFGHVSTFLVNDYNELRQLVPGLTPSIYMNNIQLKYDKRSTNLLHDVLRALQRHVNELTAPQTLERNPWVRHLYSARRDHNFNKLIKEHDRLNALVRELIRENKYNSDDPDSTESLWHANSALFALPKGMVALPTRKEQLAQGAQETHCCGIYTWSETSNLVFGMKSPQTGATATLEVNIPAQRVNQFYGPHNSIVRDETLISMKNEFLASNKELMTRLTEQLRTKGLV